MTIAQTAAARADSSPARPPLSSETVQLNPFEVQADSDKSYGALNSNSITGFNTQLDQLPLSADIYDQAFMNDVAANSVESLISTYSAGAAVTGTDPGGAAGTSQPGDRASGGGVNIFLRGLQTPGPQRDGFMPAGTMGNGITGTYDLERAEVINGPQALLYGGGGAGGVVNLVSKQARFDKTAGSLLYQIDQYGSKKALLDYNFGTANVAVRAAILDQSQRYSRLFLGGPVHGDYLQLAFKLFGNTVVRLIGDQTFYNRIKPSPPTATLTGTSPTDPRNGDSMHYLLATNQLGPINPATGAAYPGGAIDNGLVNWGNVDSFGTEWNSELTMNTYTALTAETRWTPWLSSAFTVGYDHHPDYFINTGITFAGPSYSSNPLGVWAAGTTPADTDQMTRTKGIRYSLLATNELFSGRVRSQTILAADFIRIDADQTQYNYFQADSSWNVIANPAVTALNGRTELGKIWWPIAGGPSLYQYFTPLTNRVTVNGVNYVRQITNPVNPAAISPANPLGVTLGTSNYTIAKTFNKGIFGVNESEWLEGRLTTIAGFRLAGSLVNSEGVGQAPPLAPNATYKTSATPFSYNLGVDYAVRSWLHAYAGFSDSYDPPFQISVDPKGQVDKIAQGIGQEVGLKVTSPGGALSGSLSAYHVSSKNEEFLISSTILNDINPSGLNGERFGTANQWVNANRTSEGVQLALTAAPTSNWRLRLSAAAINGKVGSTASYPQLYNDQFNENSLGQVTYADGSVVYVPATYNAKQLTVPATTAGAVPLTVTLLSTPGSQYYASPQPVNGQILSTSNGGLVLKSVDPIHGGILTGVTGLPLSAYQLNPALTGVTPPGSIVAVQSGDATTGYPQYSLNLTSVYTFAEGWMKGIRVGGTVFGSWKVREYYYYPSGISPGAPRVLYSYPNEGQVNLIAGYEHKFRRTTWSTQLNVTNLFNHYAVEIIPNENTGFSSVTSLNATFYGQPRACTWTNTFSF